jgi:transcriptional regulator with XRE-family HTH domain
VNNNTHKIQKVDFGSKLKEFCLRKFGSINNAAEELDIPRGTLSRYFSNKMAPTLKVFLKLSSAGCDMNWLFEGSKNINLGMVNEPYEGFYDKDKEITHLRLKVEELQQSLNKILKEVQNSGIK